MRCSFDVAEVQAANQGTSGTMTGLAVEASVGMATGQMVGGMMNRVLQPTANASIMPMQSKGISEQSFGDIVPRNDEKNS